MKRPSAAEIAAALLEGEGVDRLTAAMQVTDAPANLLAALAVLFPTASHEDLVAGLRLAIELGALDRADDQRR